MTLFKLSYQKVIAHHVDFWHLPGMPPPLELHIKLKHYPEFSLLLDALSIIKEDYIDFEEEFNMITFRDTNLIEGLDLEILLIQYCQVSKQSYGYFVQMVEGEVYYKLVKIEKQAPVEVIG